MLSPAELRWNENKKSPFADIAKIMTIRNRGNTDNASKSSENSKDNGKPSRPRFNPQFHRQKRPERSADGTWLDHQAWTKIVMAGALGIVVYFALHRPTSHETPLAKRSEFLNGKRSQNSLCAPPYKAEIQKLGNESMSLFVLKLHRNVIFLL